MSQDASNYRRYIEVAQVYLKLAQEDDVARILGVIIEPMLAGREENDLLELVDELLARNPEHVAGLRLLTRIHWWQRDMDKLRAALERLAEAAEAGGLVEEERYALTQLVRLAPDEQSYLDRLNTLGGFLEEISEGERLDTSVLQTVPTFEGFAIVGDGEAVIADVPAAEASEFEWNSVAEETNTHTEVSFADLNEIEINSQVDSRAAVSGDPATADPFGGGLESSAGLGRTTPGQQPDQDVGTPLSAEVMMKQELESVDFYITQEYSDIALDTLELLERQFGSHPEIESRRRRLQTNQGAQPSVATPAEPVVQSSAPGVNTNAAADKVSEAFGDIEIQQLAVAPAAQVGSGIDSGLAEIFEEFRMEAEGESASANEDYETHYNMATAYKEMDLLDEAIREFQIAAGLTGSAAGTTRYFQCCNMLGHSFLQKGMPQAAVLWFKKGLDAPGRSAEEYKALQYELGAAYEAMGDLTRAVAAFTEVYGVDVSYRDIADKLESLQERVANEKKKGK
jgi:tetratricopeptide (TPR) repeat protein